MDSFKSGAVPLTSRGLEPRWRPQTTSMLITHKKHSINLGKNIKYALNRPQAMVKGKIYIKRILSLATDIIRLSL